VRDDELAAFYPRAYNAYALPANRILRTLATVLFRWRYWRGLRRPPFAAMLHRPPGRLLDVGGGRGDLGVVLRRHGWSVTSLDPSDLACAEARSRGVDSVCGTLSDPPDTLGDAYDAVTFQHSLEHVVDPATDLAAAHDRLADGGLLIVTLPNFNCWQRRSFGADWFHLDVPRHRSHFSPAGLQALLRRCGFETIWLSTSTSADGLAMSVQYRCLGRPIGVATGRYLAAAAGLLTAPLTAALSFVTGGGDILHVQAIKPAGISALAVAAGHEDWR
jgi:SAM-dependent methyltransferase